MDLSFLKWIDHAGFAMEINGKRVYVDPFRIRGSMPKADLIFVTHPHFDHFNEDAMGKVVGSNTKFVAPKDVADKLSGKKVLSVQPGKSYTVEGISFNTVAAYNIGKEFHPKASGWVGYIIDADGRKVYHAGDTDVTEEMKRVEADVALLPIGGHYTMSLDDAVLVAGSIRAKAFVPMHYKSLLGKEGSKKAEEEFAKKIKNSAILEEVQEPYYSFQ